MKWIIIWLLLAGVVAWRLGTRYWFPYYALYTSGVSAEAEVTEIQYKFGDLGEKRPTAFLWIFFVVSCVAFMLNRLTSAGISIRWPRRNTTTRLRC